MEALPILIFFVILFNVFRSFTKTNRKRATGAGATADIMQRLKEAQAAQAQQTEQEDWKFGQDNNSPWKNKTAKVSRSNAKLKRKASHKNPVQHGRRGKNMDQNRHRNDDWGQRGDNDFLSARVLLFILVLGFIVLYVLSQIPPQ